MSPNKTFGKFAKEFPLFVENGIRDGVRVVISILSPFSDLKKAVRLYGTLVACLSGNSIKSANEAQRSVSSVENGRYLDLFFERVEIVSEIVNFLLYYLPNILFKV